MLSVIRAIGLGLAVAMSLAAARRLVRPRPGSRVPVYLQLALSVGLGLVSLVPNLVSPIRDLLGLSDVAPGRLLALLLIAVAVLYLMLLFTLTRAEAAHRRITQLVRALALEQANAGQDGSGAILVCIPALNEAENLPAVLRTVPRSVLDRRADVVVIDDGSTDATSQAATQGGALSVRHALRLGGGAALVTGYRFAARSGYEVVVTLDADGQHDPTELQNLVAPILADQADFALGSRRMGSYERDSRFRDAGITAYSWLVNRLGGTHLTDVSNGFRAARVATLSDLVLSEEQFHNAELLIGVQRAGMRIVEVPVKVRRRLSGTSKKGSNLRYGLGFLRSLLRSWLH